MSRHAGLLRDESSLRRGLSAHAEFAAAADRLAEQGTNRRIAEAQSLCHVAGAILLSALARTESRGAHFRTDFPVRDDARFQKHSIFANVRNVTFEQW